MNAHSCASWSSPRGSRATRCVLESLGTQLSLSGIRSPRNSFGADEEARVYLWRLWYTYYKSLSTNQMNAGVWTDFVGILLKTLPPPYPTMQSIKRRPKNNNDLCFSSFSLLMFETFCARMYTTGKSLTCSTKTCAGCFCLLQIFVNFQREGAVGEDYSSFLTFDFIGLKIEKDQSGKKGSIFSDRAFFDIHNVIKKRSAKLRWTFFKSNWTFF